MQQSRSAVNLMTSEGLHRDSVTDFLTLELSEQLEPGREYSLSLDFTAPLRKDLDGFYRSSYRQGGRRIYLATTQFEATHARKAFPCFDEPAIKATFEVSLGRLYHMSSLSNMPKKDMGTGEPM